MYDQSIEEHFDLQNGSTDDLLAIIGDNSYILSYIIDNRNTYENAMENQFTLEIVKQTLKELGVKRHLLSKKPIQQWSASDYLEYQMMLKKVARPSARYAILPTTIAQEDT